MKSTPVAPASPDEVVAFLIDAASQAPSVHNTQPWWFGVRGSRLTLHADGDRRLEVADPDGREMFISCGAALFTLRLAARHLGHVAEERLWPDPERTTLLADVDIARQRPATADEQRMFDQVTRRRTHRGGFTGRKLPPALLSKLSIEARREGASLRGHLPDGMLAGCPVTVQNGGYVGEEQQRFGIQAFGQQRSGQILVDDALDPLGLVRSVDDRYATASGGDERPRTRSCYRRPARMPPIGRDLGLLCSSLFPPSWVDVRRSPREAGDSGSGVPAETDQGPVDRLDHLYDGVRDEGHEGHA
jgi:hypothetical protein